MPKGTCLDNCRWNEMEWHAQNERIRRHGGGRVHEEWGAWTGIVHWLCRAKQAIQSRGRALVKHWTSSNDFRGIPHSRAVMPPSNACNAFVRSAGQYLCVRAAAQGQRERENQGSCESRHTCIPHRGVKGTSLVLRPTRLFVPYQLSTHVLPSPICLPGETLL